MAFLRSGKFFRFLSASKNLVNFREYEVPRPLPVSCVCSAQNFATNAASIPAQSLENSLKRLDQDVRRSGRISRRDLEEILDEIRTNKTATSSQSLLVIRCCGNLVPEELPENRTKMVQEIWKTLSKLNVPMDISHYNALLRVYLENEYAFSPTEFLADLKSKGVEPNRVTYQRLISRYCQQGDIEGATQILEFMREKQLPVNENVFNALIMGHSNADDFESAAGILSVMTQAGLEPSADTYTILLCGFARKGDLDSINKYVVEADEKEVMLLDKDFLEVIYTLAVNGHGEKVTALFDKLKKAFGYNQDAVNVILRLVNRGQIDIALKVLETMPRATKNSGELADTGSFLIRQLVKAKRPVDEILKICKEFEDTGLHAKPILTALESSLMVGNLELIKALMNEMYARGLEIRVHYFWPAFRACKSEAEVIELCKSMQDDFKMKLTNQTIRDYVLPRIITGDTYEDAIQKLRNIGVSAATAASTAAFHALNRNKIEKASEIMGSFDSYFSPGLFRKPLLSAFSATKDFTSYVKILRHINDNMSRASTINQQRQEEEDEEDEIIEGAEPASDKAPRNIQNEVLGDMVVDAVSYFKSNRVEVATKVLQGLVDQGLSISSSKAERIQERLGETMTSEISVLLGKLTSGELEPVHIEKTKMQRSTLTPVDRGNDIENLERLIRNIEAKGENPKGLKRQLLVAAIRAKNIEKTQEVVERLKAEGYTLTAGVYAQLVELYSSADRLDEALDALKKIREIEREFELDEIKTVKVAQAYVNADRIDEAIKFLEENKLKEVRDEKQFNYQNTCWRFLNSLAEKGNAAELNKVFEAMVVNNYIVPNNILLGPLIKVHLVQDDLKTAVDKFEEICKKHRATPWKSDLACRLIQAEDAANLQRITDLSSEIHGEVNSLYDLVFSFIECGRVRQARKILEAPGLRTRPGRINSACERYLNEGMPSALEGLVEATKDLSHIDRSEIYYSLLQNYIKDKAPEKALNLWTTMQEEDITPSDAFLSKLASFLESEGRPVPFHRPATLVEPEVAQEVNKVAPVKSQPKAKQTRAQKMAEAPQKDITETVAALKQAIKAEDVDAIVKAKQNLTATDKVSLHDRSAVVESLVKNGRLAEATKAVTEILEDKLTPLPNVFRFYLNRIAATGDSDTLTTIGSYLSSEKKKVVSFDNRMCHSYVAGGKSDAYLDKLEEIIDNAKTEEEVKKADEEFPRGGAIGIIDQHPESIERFHKVAQKYADKKIIGPVNVLWMHFFIRYDPRAETVFKEHLTNAPRLMFQRVIQMARRNEDEKLVMNLITVLNEAKVSEGAIGNAYSCLIDICAAKNNSEACLNAVNDCVKAVSFENVNRTALMRAKECVESAGKKFPHTIPDKKTSTQDSSSSSSSSSSDEEVTRKEHS